MNFTDRVNVQQQQAITTGLGPVQVLAGPGSGKTRVLTLRIAYLIATLGVQPYNILAVTFTNKAAKQMNQRVEDLLGTETRGLTLGTFHSICARLLRREAESLPFSNNFVIFDDDDQRNVVKLAIREMNIDDKRFRPRSVHSSISRAKNELILPEDFPLNTYRDEVVQRVYKRYQEMLLNNNALDFDDLLLWVARMLEEQPEIRQKYARRFEHILVDEFQDTNQAQYILLSHLASFHRNIFVVGDTDQSIYRWRGADYRNIQRFEKDFPDSQIILLEQNYRSTQNILDVAMAVINRNHNRKQKQLFTDRGKGAKILLHEAFDARDEGQFIINQIATATAKGKAEPGDFAIMYRTNAQSRLLEESFLHANLPYKLVGAQRFYGRREIKDVLAYMRLIHNTQDEISLARVINTPRRKIGAKTINDLRQLALNENKGMGAILLEFAQDKSDYLKVFTPAAGRSLGFFAKLLFTWVKMASSVTTLELMDKVLNDIDYQNYLNDGSEEGIERWENVMEMRRLASEYQDRSLTDFLEEVALVSDQDTVDASANAPTLLTLHAAKGLEFPRVFITGLEDGTLPHARSFDDPEGMAEERRLFYVGITRAMDRLYLIHALNRATYGYSESTDPSRFLDDIPEDLLQEGSSISLSKPMRKLRSQGADRWESAASAPIIEPIYMAGQKVRHGSYGEGMVLVSKIDGGEEIVEVFFDGKGLKKLIASLAKLEVVED